MKIETKYDLKNIVEITELKRPGVIKSIWLTDQGIEYQVRYFDSGEARTVYFFEDELKIKL